MKRWFENMFGKGEDDGNKGNGKRQPKKSQAQSKATQPKGEPPHNNKNKKKPAVAVKRSDFKKDEKKSTSRKSRSVESVFNTSRPQSSTAVEHFGSRLTALNGTPQGQNIYDVCAYFLHCTKHNKIAVRVEEKSDYTWLPFVFLPSSRTWSDGAFDGANIVLSGGEPNLYISLKENPVISGAHCMQLFRLQLAQTQKFNTRLIYYIKLKDSCSNFRCCADTKYLRWLSLEDVLNSKVEKMFGPEVVLFGRRISSSIVLEINEYSLDDAFLYVPRDPPRNLEEAMLKSTNFTEKDVERLYSDFIEHCFPSFFMTQTSFDDYMSKYGFEKMDKKLELLFKAFNFHRNNFLTFYEFLIGLTSIDPNAVHGQSRLKFVFKYFDVDGDGFLNEKEFTSMTREIHPKDSDSEIKRKVKDSMKIIGLKKNGVFFDDFNKAVGAHKFRGTSGLCRSNQPIVQQISRSMASRTLKRTTGKSSLGSILANYKYKGICESCKEKRYEFAIHRVTLNSEGRCCDAQCLPEVIEMNNTSNETTLNSSSIDNNSSKGSNDSVKSVPSGVVGFTREKYSTDIVWNPRSVANHLLQLIRDFNNRKGKHTDNRGLMDGPSERGPFVKRLKELCTEVQKIVSQEDRCVKVSSPAFVIGDIHGNIEDLFTMERVLWKGIPIVSANYVFLGDYVDRGKWGLECAVYLMCLKLLAPNKIVLLRGNHEVRDLQKNYTYKKECLRKYGDELGLQVFETTNQVFDRLAFCAVIDDAIYCAHGGIPASTRLIQKINEVNSDLKDPERESAIAWEILWSDPIGPNSSQKQQIY